LHETTKENIENMNEKYRIAGSEGRKEIKLEPGDLVWLHLRKYRFLELCKLKLIPRAVGPYKVIEKTNDNTYKLELPPHSGVSPSFNISDLNPLWEKKITLSRGRLQFKRGRIIRTSLLWMHKMILH
jgi:hypothetical protein